VLIDTATIDPEHCITHWEGMMSSNSSICIDHNFFAIFEGQFLRRLWYVFYVLGQ